MKYRITIEELVYDDESRYPGATQIYQQVVEGDDSIIASTMLNTWRYIEAQKPVTDKLPDLDIVKPVLVKKGKLNA